MTVSVLIPYGYQSAWQHQIFHLVCDWWETEFPTWRIAVGDSKHPFNRAEARNCAAERAEGDVYIICDADTVPHTPDQVAEMAAQVGSNPQKWFLPMGYVQMDERWTTHCLAQTDVFEPPPSYVLNHYENVPGGFRIIHRDAFQAVGGFDMGFRGWGYEDTAFMEAVSTVINEPTRQGVALHLWHPLAADRGPQSPQANRGRYNLYERARGDREGMLNVLYSLNLLERPLDE